MNFPIDLCDPETGEELILSADSSILVSQSGKAYKIVDSIPVLLPESELKNIHADTLHETFQSPFHYLEHYRQDALTFDYFAAHASAVTRDEIKRLEEVIASEVPPEAQIILDAGCGNGWVAKKFTASRKVISMDIAVTNVSKALKNIPSENHYGLVADVFQLPIKRDSVDCIIAAEVMEHVADPKLFIQKLLFVLKPGGTLIITTPFNEKIEYYLCVHCNRPTPKNAHLHSFNFENVKTIVPEGSSVSAFHNHYMLKLRSYILTRFFPLALWKITDSAANMIFGNPSRMLIKIKK